MYIYVYIHVQWLRKVSIDILYLVYLTISKSMFAISGMKIMKIVSFPTYVSISINLCFFLVDFSSLRPQVPWHRPATARARYRVSPNGSAWEIPNMWTKSREKQHKWLGIPNFTMGNGGKTSRKLWETMRTYRINAGL